MSAEDAVGYGIGLFLAVLAISVLAMILSLLAEIWRDRK